MAEQYRLEMVGVSKSFPGVKALDGISLKVRPGTVHALMGENGAGKSTLMKCLFGIYKMDEGKVFIDGEQVNIANPDEALKKGLAMVHQELQPIPDRSIAENMYLGRYPMKGVGPLRMINHKKMNEEAEKWLRNVKMDFDPKMKLGTLSIGQMQSVEIAKAVSQNAKLVILDEPTSSLTDNEVEALFRIIRDLKSRGVSMIYISHKMAELRQISDDITIMRDGTYVGSWKMADISDDEIVKQMVGRELTNVYPPKEDYRTNETVLKVEHLCSIHERSFQDCSFELKRGEILGFGGLVGAQRTEMMEAIFGMRHVASGKIEVLGKEVTIKRPEDAIDDSIGMITEDRRGTGILGCLSINDNTAIASYKHYTNAGVIDQKKVDAVVQDSIKKLNIKTPSGKTLIQSLSGGNQQKVIIARWLANNPDILIMDEPTRGIDVGAKYEIYQIMIDLVKQGKSIIMISSEMPELIGMSNRIIVMCNGHITGELEGEEATQEQIMACATQFDLRGKSAEK
ncbi:sugar ABC transporter ATP-binding protein [Brotaphodocola catenula]|uniref:Ribose/galactose/methyl galactoside import ATP-binding protein n=1 Tax=Brotaphodocola catenula TaxID=2885361 RepID=A0AAE3AU89_9FIRM|nr:sugar ABC transporter ATP-binding protein [Brotaphodocola catenula]MCC2165432.1 sugar ABC transporter ATP-binding protein [Brotaphodocola catenula]